MSARSRRYRKNPASGGYASNPPMLTDIGTFILPGFGGYAASRVATRMVSTQVSKLKPSLGKHAGMIASVGSFVAAWFLIHRVKWLAKYHTPLVVGAGIATLQTAFQTYLPMVGWVTDLPAPQVAAPQRAGTHAPTSGTVVAVHPNRSTAHVDVGHVAATKRLFGIYP
jgi:hypothetical protein